jgi:hypothetical protein
MFYIDLIIELIEFFLRLIFNFKQEIDFLDNYLVSFFFRENG